MDQDLESKRYYSEATNRSPLCVVSLKRSCPAFCVFRHIVSTSHLWLWLGDLFGERGKFGYWYFELGGMSKQSLLN